MIIRDAASSSPASHAVDSIFIVSLLSFQRKLCICQKSFLRLTKAAQSPKTEKRNLFVREMICRIDRMTYLIPNSPGRCAPLPVLSSCVSPNSHVKKVNMTVDCSLLWRHKVFVWNWWHPYFPQGRCFIRLTQWTAALWVSWAPPACAQIERQPTGLCVCVCACVSLKI